MFDDPRWQRLGLRDARYIAPWDALRDPASARSSTRGWRPRARPAAASLLGFDALAALASELARTLPATVALRARVPPLPRALSRRARLDRVERGQPPVLADRRTGRAAPRSTSTWSPANCPGCRIVAADVLDVSGMTAWVRRFQRHAVNRRGSGACTTTSTPTGSRTPGTRALLAITDAGRSGSPRPAGSSCGASTRARRSRASSATRERHAARATRHALRLACLSPRIRRVYLYHWQAPHPVTNWDSAFVGPRGRVRPAYRTLQRRLAGGLPLPLIRRPRGTPRTRGDDGVAGPLPRARG